jgi:LPS-assembly protein
MQSEYVNFEHSDDDNIKGHRFDFEPGVSLPLNRRWGYLTPKASLRYTSYFLDNQVSDWDDNPDRLLPTFSLDSGLFLERNASWFGDTAIQTLEPRLFYLGTPYVDQEDLPNFDTSNVTFGFPSLFQENRFAGSDKVGDANQLTAALTSRMLSDSTGAELLRASIGQIFYFRDRKVQLSGDTPATENSSAVVAELASELNQNWRFRAGIQWDPNESDNEVKQGLFSMHYKDGEERLLNAEYNYTRDSVEQTDLSGRWPVSNRWSLVGRWTYSQLFEETVQAFAGIEYDNCCWRVRLIGQQLLTNIDSDPDNSLLLQFQLKGLGGWGTADDEFLERNISGYRAIR